MKKLKVLVATLLLVGCADKNYGSKQMESTRTVVEEIKHDLSGWTHLVTIDQKYKFLYCYRNGGLSVVQINPAWAFPVEPKSPSEKQR